MISLRNITKIYQRGRNRVVAIDRVTLEISKGEFLAVMGASGCGKSTLINLIGCLDFPTEGEVIIDGTTTRGLSDEELTLIRRHKIGIVFQFFNLLPTLTAKENIALPLLLDGVPFHEASVKADQLLEQINLQKRGEHKPHELSGGEAQRVAIARALAKNPAILLADEPTGNLDSETSEDVLTLLRETSERFGQTLVLVTHDATAASFAHRIIQMKDGKIMD